MSIILILAAVVLAWLIVSVTLALVIGRAIRIADRKRVRLG